MVKRKMRRLPKASYKLEELIREKVAPLLKEDTIYHRFHLEILLLPIIEQHNYRADIIIQALIDNRIMEHIKTDWGTTYIKVTQ